MPVRVCLSANTITCPEAGGLFWIYLNWALGLRALGCEVIWLESVVPKVSERKLRRWISTLKESLRAWDLDKTLALCSWTAEPLPAWATEGLLDLEAAAEADLLLNQQYGLREAVVGRFRRRALLDIDPGLLQSWMAGGHLQVAPHDLYFTIGETVGERESRIPDVGLDWVRIVPCVFLEAWPVTPSSSSAPFTAVSSWDGGEWMEDEDGVYQNDKYTGFQPLLELPSRTSQSLELALSLAPSQEDEARRLRSGGWGVKDVMEVAATPMAYRSYIQSSGGEFGWAKPSYVKLRTAWLSDRTVCYLASGKPVVLQNTGPSRFLPDGAGMFRFHDLAEAARCLETVASDYARQSRLARQLAEEHFDAKRVLGGVLERALEVRDHRAGLPGRGRQAGE